MQIAREEQIGVRPGAKACSAKVSGLLLGAAAAAGGRAAGDRANGRLWLLMRSDLGLLLAGLVWPLALVGGLLMGIFMLGLVFGWPLMWGAISTEGTDSFDALSRSYSYVYQRPYHYLFYSIVQVPRPARRTAGLLLCQDAVVHSCFLGDQLGQQQRAAR